MTPLRKTIRRKTFARIFSKGLHREIIVELSPPDLVGFRLKGERRTYHLPAEWCFRRAVAAWVESEKRRKREERKAAKRAKGDAC